MSDSLFAKHLGKGCEVEIDGEKYVLKPLSTNYIPDFIKVMKSMSKLKENSTPEEIMGSFSDESMESIRKIIDATLKKSFSEEWKEHEEDTRAFGMKFMMLLLPAIMKINSVNVESDDKKRSEVIKERLSPKK